MILKGISWLLVCIWNIRNWPLVSSFKDFISKAVSNSLELPFLHVVNLSLLSISCVHFYILSSELGIRCLFFFFWCPLIFSTLYFSSSLTMSGGGTGSLCWLVNSTFLQHVNISWLSKMAKSFSIFIFNFLFLLFSWITTIKVKCRKGVMSQSQVTTHDG